MAEEKLKVIFKRVFVLDDSDWEGSGEFYFKVTVGWQGRRRSQTHL